MKLLFKSILVALMAGQTCLSNAQSELTLNSSYLDTLRTVNLFLPQHYDPDKKYPVIYAFDGEYTGSLLAGNMDFLSFLEEVPPSIVVSIPQKTIRYEETGYVHKTGELNEKSTAFFNFIKKELIPFIDSSYATTSFRVILGHSLTGNFVNYFLFDTPPVFSGYLAFSPYFAKGTKSRLKSLKKKKNNFETPIYYFLCQGEDDIQGHTKSINDHKPCFDSLNSSGFYFDSHTVPKGRHTSQIIHALPKALKFVFKDYSVYDMEDYKRMKRTSTSALTQLKSHYQRIKKIYGLEVPYRTTDLQIVQHLLYEREKWGHLEEMGEIAIDTYSEKPLGYYAKGTSLEKQGKLEKALSLFKKGYANLGEDCLNKEDFYKDIERVEKKIKGLEEGD